MIAPDLIVLTVLFSLLGVAISMLLVFLPGLHIYNIVGFAVLIYIPLAGLFDPIILGGLFIGMIVSFTVFFTCITTLYFQAPDDSTVFIILPSSRSMMLGKAHETVLLTSISSITGLYVVVLGLVALGPRLSLLYNVLRPHVYWIIGLVIVYLLMTEWPKDFGVGQTRLQRLVDGWSSLAAGYLTFFLSALLGMIVFYKTMIPPEDAFSNLAPLFVGLFAVPSVILNLVARTKIPKQHIAKSAKVNAEQILRVTGSGTIGGAFGSLIPGVTAGPAGLFTGHATAQRDSTMFIMSIGTVRILYYVGGMMAFMYPLMHLRRGGLAINFNLFFIPETFDEFYILAGCVLIAGAATIVATLLLSRVAAKLVSSVSYKYISIAVLVIIIIIIYLLTSWQGLLIMSLAAAIGTIPVVFHSRRTNLLAALLVPLWLNIAGLGPIVAAMLGLI